MASEDQTEFFAAYGTASANDSPRVLIPAEQIVVILERDEEGCPLEISISLKRPEV